MQSDLFYLESLDFDTQAKVQGICKHNTHLNFHKNQQNCRSTHFTEILNPVKKKNTTFEEGNLVHIKTTMSNSNTGKNQAGLEQNSPLLLHKLFGSNHPPYIAVILIWRLYAPVHT